MTVHNPTPCADQLDRLQPLTVTVATAKRLSGLGHTTIWDLIKCQSLEVVRVRRRTLIVYRSLQDLLSARQPQIPVVPSSKEAATRGRVKR
jgi:hypothetical protein